jgi:hypothetical protein
MSRGGSGKGAGTRWMPSPRARNDTHRAPAPEGIGGGWKSELKRASRGKGNERALDSDGVPKNEIEFPSVIGSSPCVICYRRTSHRKFRRGYPENASLEKKNHRKAPGARKVSPRAKDKPSPSDASRDNNAKSQCQAQAQAKPSARRQIGRQQHGLERAVSSRKRMRRDVRPRQRPGPNLKSPTDKRREITKDETREERTTQGFREDGSVASVPAPWNRGRTERKDARETTRAP